MLINIPVLGVCLSFFVRFERIKLFYTVFVSGLVVLFDVFLFFFIFLKYKPFTHMFRANEEEKRTRTAPKCLFKIGEKTDLKWCPKRDLV